MDLPGDETGVDGKIKTTILFDDEDVQLPSGITGIMKLVDEDGSTEYLKIHTQIEPQPPFIQGKVTDKTTGAGIQNIIVLAENQEESRVGITDQNGDYQIPVINGT